MAHDVYYFVTYYIIHEDWKKKPKEGIFARIELRDMTRVNVILISYI